jgi:hypothetical protein
MKYFSDPSKTRWSLVGVLGLALISAGYAVTSKSSSIGALIIGLGSALAASAILEYIISPDRKSRQEQLQDLIGRQRITLESYLQTQRAMVDNGVLRLHARGRDIPHDWWHGFYSGAKEVDLCGRAMLGRIQGDAGRAFKEMVSQTLERGGRVRVLLANPRHDLYGRSNKDGISNTREALRLYAEMRSEMVPSHQERFSIRVTRKVPIVTLICRADKRMVVAPYLLDAISRDTHHYELDSVAGGFFDLYARDFDTFWSDKYSVPYVP